MTQQDDITQRVLTDDEIEALAKKHIAPHADRLDAIMANPVPYQKTEQFRRVKALIVDVLSKLRPPVSSIREGFELTYAADADDPACASDLSHFTNGWRACVMSQVRAPVADERALDLLDTLFTAYENGTPCYDEPDSQGGYLGMAFRIDDDTFRACADLLNKERPRTAAALASAPVQWPTMPPSKGQSPVLFEDGYAEGWAKCMDECRRALIAASNYIDTLGGDSKSYRAALSAPQAEQGERDAD